MTRRLRSWRGDDASCGLSLGNYFSSHDDVLGVVLSKLSSKDRSKLCTVSTRWCRILLALLSESVLPQHKHAWLDFTAPRRVAACYHLYVRTKMRICSHIIAAGDVDVIDHYINGNRLTRTQRKQRKHKMLHLIAVHREDAADVIATMDLRAVPHHVIRNIYEAACTHGNSELQERFAAKCLYLHNIKELLLSHSIITKNVDESLIAIGTQAFWFACAHGDPKTFEKLVAMGVRLPGFLSGGLGRACTYGNLPMVKWILSVDESPMTHYFDYLFAMAVNGYGCVNHADVAQYLADIYPIDYSLAIRYVSNRPAAMELFLRIAGDAIKIHHLKERLTYFETWWRRSDEYMIVYLLAVIASR